MSFLINCILLIYWPFILIVASIFLFVWGLSKKRFTAHPIYECKDICSSKVRYWSKKNVHNSIALLLSHFFSIVLRILSPLQYMKIIFKNQRNDTNPNGDVPAWFTEGYMFLWIAYELLLLINPLINIYRELISIILLYQSILLIFNAIYYSFLRPAFYGNKPVHYIYRNIILLVFNYLELILIFSLIYYMNSELFFDYDDITNITDAIYFSIVTITTLGYGDITPTKSIGKIIVASEALFGTMLLVIALARMIGITKHPGAHIDESENK